MDILMNQLTKSYGSKKVLDIQNLNIKKGSLCGIIGSNGAGKSTLLNIIAGLEKADDGSILYGETKEKLIPRHNMTLVFQTPYMLSTTVEKNIAYPLKLRNWSEADIKERVQGLMDDLGLSELRKRKSTKLSGGETQKVALARALSFRPKLLLLDEPTANIDPEATADIERILKKINAEGDTTVIIITHNLVQAKRLCSDIVFLHKGKTIEVGSAEQVLREPNHELTKKFVSGELLT